MTSSWEAKAGSRGCTSLSSTTEPMKPLISGSLRSWLKLHVGPYARGMASMWRCSRYTDRTPTSRRSTGGVVAWSRRIHLFPPEGRVLALGSEPLREAEWGRRSPEEGRLSPDRGLDPARVEELGRGGRSLLGYRSRDPCLDAEPDRALGERLVARLGARPDDPRLGQSLDRCPTLRRFQHTGSC